jgi:hypothetical protein
MIEKELLAKPLVSGHSKYSNSVKTYYEKVILYDDEYPFAMVHIDLFYQRDGDSSIYDTLNAGQQIKIIASFKTAGEYLNE